MIDEGSKVKSYNVELLLAIPTTYAGELGPNYFDHMQESYHALCNSLQSSVS